MSTPTEITRYALPFTGSAYAAAVDVVLTSAIHAGDDVLVFIVNYNGAAVTGVADSNSASYTIDVSETGTSGTVFSTVTRLHNSAALAANGTNKITVTFNTGPLMAEFLVVTMASGLLASPLDVSAVDNTGSTATPSVGPTSATTVASEIVFALFGTYAGGTAETFTAGSGYTGFSILQQPSGTLYLALGVEYKVLSATGTQTATGTFSASNLYYANIIAAYKGAAADAYPLGYGPMQQPSPTTLRM